MNEIKLPGELRSWIKSPGRSRKSAIPAQNQRFEIRSIQGNPQDHQVDQIADRDPIGKSQGDLDQPKKCVFGPDRAVFDPGSKLPGRSDRKIPGRSDHRSGDPIELVIRSDRAGDHDPNLRFWPGIELFDPGNELGSGIRSIRVIHSNE